MSDKTELQKVSEEIMRFMRGKYMLDEVGDGKDKLEFCESGKSILTIRIQEDRFDFIVDGKCISVADLETLEAAKQLIMIKKKPDRKPFPKEQAVYANCGYRCDLCVHYTGGTISDALRAELKVRLIRVYAGGVGDGGYWGDDMAFCGGCATDGCMTSLPDAPCNKRICMASKGVGKCISCAQYPCYNESTHGFHQIHTLCISADDVTKAILPFVPDQYGN